MRIERLHLHPFGHFNNRELTFDSVPLVLIYGRNESGKSTILQSIRESLFGFTKQAFSENGDLRTHLQCRLNDGSQVSFVRRRFGKRSSFEEGTLQGQALSEEQWLARIGDMDPQTYMNVFGFGLHELAIGEASLKGSNLTEAILGSGQSKVIDWKRIREGIEKERSELLTQRGRVQLIPDLIKKLRHHQTETEAEWVRPRQYRELCLEKEKLQQTQGQLIQRQNELRRSHHQRKRALEALPLAKQYGVLVQKRSEINLPEWMTADWARMWKTLQTEWMQFDQELNVLKRELNTITEEIAKIPCDSPLESAYPELQRLLGQSTNMLETYQRLQVIETQIAASQLAEAKTVEDLQMAGSRAEWDQMPLGAMRSSQFHEIVAPYRQALQEMESLGQEQKQIALEQELLERELDHRQSTLFSTVSQTLWHQAREAFERYQRLSIRDEQCHEWKSESERIEQHWRAWNASLDWLRELPIPNLESLQRAEKEAEHWKNERQSIQKELHRLEQEQLQWQAEKALLESTGAIPTWTQLQTVRQRRDQILTQWITNIDAKETPLPLLPEEDASPTLWSKLPEDQESESQGVWEPTQTSKAVKKTQASSSLAKKLKSLILQSDTMADALLQNAATVAQRDRLEASLRQQEERLQLLRKQLSEIETLEANVLAEHQEVQRKLPFAVADLYRIRPLCEDALRYRSLHERMDEHTTQVAKDGDQLNQLLEALMKAMAIDAETVKTTFPSLHARWQYLQELCNQAQRNAGTLEAQQQAVSRLHQRAKILASQEEEIAAKLTHYRTSFERWLSETGLPSDVTPDAAEKLLHGLADLRQHRADRERFQLEHREHTKRLQEYFESSREVLSSLQIIPHEAIHGLLRQLEQALQQASEVFEKKRQRELLWVRGEEKTQTYSSLQAQWQERHERRTKILQETNGDASDLDRWTSHAQQYWDLQNEILGMERQLQLLNESGMAMSDWIASLSCMDSFELEQGLNEDSQALEQVEQTLQENLREQGRIEQKWNELQREDPTSRIAAEKQDLLGQLESASERWMVLSIAEQLLHAAMQRFHGSLEHEIQQDMVGIFSRLTQQRYVDLQPDPKNTASFLVVDRSGYSKSPSQLSTGTREQLYLAIRLAHVRHYCRNYEPLPLVLDDCFVNFDDDRLHATLETIQELSGSQQVILLSCHERMMQAMAKLPSQSQILTLESPQISESAS